MNWITEIQWIFHVTKWRTLKWEAEEQQQQHQQIYKCITPAIIVHNSGPLILLLADACGATHMSCHKAATQSRVCFCDNKNEMKWNEIKGIHRRGCRRQRATHGNRHKVAMVAHTVSSWQPFQTVPGPQRQYQWWCLQLSCSAKHQATHPPNPNSSHRN